jgi:hypothetical protein
MGEEERWEQIWLNVKKWIDFVHWYNRIMATTSSNVVGLK